MSIYNDEYRYVLTKNSVRTNFGYFIPLVVIILARIQHFVYRNINFKDELTIRNDFEFYMSKIYEISYKVLKLIELNKVTINGHNCILEVTLGFDILGEGPINIKAILNL